MSQTASGVILPPGYRVDFAAPPTSEQGESQPGTFYKTLDPSEDDYSSAWRRPVRWDTIEKMRGDPLVQASLAALTYPVLAAELLVEAASDSPEDREIADFIEDGLHTMTTDLMSHRIESLDAVGNGVSLFETVYERRGDDMIYLRKLALRPNKTITDWHTDEHGGPDGVTQQLARGQNKKLEMNQLLAFNHMPRGNSLLGTPALRAMYRPWLILDRMTRVTAIGHERNSMGMPWARYVGGNNAEALRIDRALMAMHAHEKGFWRIDQDVTEWGFKGVEGELKDPVPFMEYQRRDLFLSALAQFLALGTDGMGSMALSGDHSSFFMLAVKFIAHQIEVVYDRYLIPSWVGYNWDVDKSHFPHIKHGVIDQRKAGDWAMAVQTLLQSGVELPMKEIQQTSARLLGFKMPKVIEAASDVVVQDPSITSAEKETSQQFAGVTFDAHEELLSIIYLREAGITVDFALMEKELNASTERLAKKLTELQAKQARILAKKSMKILKGGKATVNGEVLTRTALVAAIQARATTVDQVALAELPFDLPVDTVPHEEERVAIEDEFWRLFGVGSEEAQRELEQGGVAPGDPPLEEPILPYWPEGISKEVAALSAVWALALARRTLGNWETEMIRQLSGGLSDEGELRARIPAGGRATDDIAQKTANTALGTGRQGVLLANGVKNGLYTAAMDNATCPVCRALDGQTVAVAEQRVPNPECEGGDRCRCEIVGLPDGQGVQGE